MDGTLPSPKAGRAAGGTGHQGDCLITGRGPQLRDLSCWRLLWAPLTWLPRVAGLSKSCHGPLHWLSPTCFSHWQGQTEGQVMTSMSSPQRSISRRDKGGQTGDQASAGCAVILIKHLQCNPSWVSSTPTFATPENLIISQNIYYQVS